MSIRVGVDVGGTNTDAVVVRGEDVVGTFKSLTTTPDTLAGVVQSIRGALGEAGVGPEAVRAVMLGTTQFVNACIQCKGLAQVGVLRLCGPATRGLPPFSDLPPALRAAVGAGYALLPGGHEYDGRQEIAPLGERGVRAAARQLLRRGVRSLVVCSVFSPVQPAHEERAAALVAAEARSLLGSEAAGSVYVCQSQQVGQLGLLERENAAILNAALVPLARSVVPQCQQAVRDVGISAPLFFTANDGTLLSAEDALQMPVATFQSGPVNSLRGAAFLSGISNALVLDIGGTTTDCGALVDGLPRPAPRAVRFAGVTTNMQMPDVLSVGLGGGSVVRCQKQGAGAKATTAAGPADAGETPPYQGRMQAQPQVPPPAADSLQPEAAGTSTNTAGAAAWNCTVGPDSTGSELLQRALCMGGDTCTASDVALVLRHMQLPGAGLPPEDQLSGAQAQAAWAAIQGRLEECVDACKAEAGDVLVIVVGGGAPLCGEALAGAARLVRPPHAAVANAVGAAIPQVSGSVDAVFQLGPSEDSRHAVMRQAECLATERAVAAGAVPAFCHVAVWEEVPLAYLPGNTCRLRVKVVGDLLLDGTAGGEQQTAGGPTSSVAAGPDSPQPQQSREEQVEGPSGGSDSSGTSLVPQYKVQQPAADAADAAGALLPAGALLCTDLVGRPDDPGTAELAAWEPVVDARQGAWLVQEADLHLLAIGAGILGAGGGGSPGRAKLKAIIQLQRAGRGSMRVISPAALPDDQLVAEAGFMGAPTVGIEKLDSDQAAAAVHAAMAAFRSTGPSGSGAVLAAVMAGEIGGGNGIEPLVVGSRMGLPVVDGDLMGRAFPELQMTTAAICGLPVTPAALADEKGNAVAVQTVHSAAWLERLLRPVCTEMGCSAGFTSCPLSGEQLKRVIVPHSLSYAWRLGKAVVEAQHNKADPAQAAAHAGGGQVLFTGKVVDVERRTTEGFARGHIELAGLGAWSGPARMRISFQNENLVASLDGRQVASVPDIISCVELENGIPVSTEHVRYGLRLAVLGLPAHPLLTNPEALEVVGPAAFGHPEASYQRLAPYTPPQPLLPALLPQQ